MPEMSCPTSSPKVTIPGSGLLKPLQSNQGILSMNPSKSAIQLILCASCLFLWGCETYQPSQVTGRRVENPQVGFGGFRFEAPEGYEQYFPPEDPKKIGNIYAYAAWKVASNLDGIAAGLTTDEVIGFKSYSCGLSVTVTHVMTHAVFSKMKDQTLKAYAEENARLFHAADNSEINYRKAEKIGNRWVAMISQTISTEAQDFVSIVYVFAGSLREEIAISGVADLHNHKKLESEMESVVRSFRFGKE